MKTIILVRHAKSSWKDPSLGTKEEKEMHHLWEKN
jgi:phosphohistidine phosphatase SixA